MRKEEMVQKKPFPHVSLDNGITSPSKTGVSCRKMSQNDDKHWDFLEEIEAPLWVDLTLECQSGYNDKNDEWFHVNHPFHQCASRHLISGFAHSAEDRMNLELDILEKYSPKLPPSVSKSRGKDYRSSVRVRGNQMVTFNIQPPVKNLNKKSFASSGSTRMTGSKTSKGRTIGLAGSNSDSRGESSLTENAGQHDTRMVPPLCDQKSASNSSLTRKGESNSSSTITSDGSGQLQKSLEVSSHVFGQTRGFLSALKVSLRKSCVTRQASRVEVTNGRLSEGQKSSSSKSSVGSSSNLGYDRKYLTARDNKDMTPDSRNVRIPVVHHQKVYETKLSNATGVRSDYTITYPKLRSQNYKSPFINQGNAKVKFQKQTFHAKVLVPHGVKKKCPPASAVKIKEKAVPRSSAQIPGGGKENPAGKVAPRQKSSTRSTTQVQRVTTRVPEKSVRTTLVVSKERVTDRTKGQKTGTIAEKVYLR